MRLLAAQAGGKGDGGGCLSDPAFLRGNGDGHTVLSACGKPG